MRIVVLAGGIGGARFLLGVRACARRARAPRSPPSSTSATTSRCTACGSALTWTASCTRSAAAPTPSGAGAGSARPGRSRRSWPRTAPSRPGSASATRTSPRTWCAPACSTPATRSRPSPRRCAARWQPGVRLLPATDDRVETHVVVDRRPAAPGRSTSRSGGSATGPRCPPTASSSSARTPPSRPPGCWTRSAAADVVLLAPSNPVVSVAPILAVPGIREAVVAAPGPGRRASPRSSAARRCAAWPTAASR